MEPGDIPVSIFFTILLCVKAYFFSKALAENFEGNVSLESTTQYILRKKSAVGCGIVIALIDVAFFYYATFKFGSGVAPHRFWACLIPPSAIYLCILAGNARGRRARKELSGSASRVP